MSVLTQRQGNVLSQSTVIPGDPIVVWFVGSCSNVLLVVVGGELVVVVVVVPLTVELPVVVVSTRTILDPAPTVPSVVVPEDSVPVVVVPGVTSLMIVSVQALRKKHPARTTNPLMRDLYTWLSLMKYN